MKLKQHYLESTFPEIFETIMSYIKIDNDFRNLCIEFEEVSELIYYLEKSEMKRSENIKTQICKHKQLRATLISDIYNFILEEKQWLHTTNENNN